MAKSNEQYTKEYVYEHGIDFEDLWFTSYSDEILDNAEDEGGKPFTGLAYEKYDNGELNYFSFYEDGMAHGLQREFYSNGHLKTEEYMKYGQLHGESKSWYENGNIRSVTMYEHSIALEKREWDSSGNLILEIKLERTDDHYTILESRRETHKNLGRK